MNQATQTQEIPINNIEVIDASQIVAENQISEINFHDLPLMFQRLLTIISGLSFVEKIKMPIYKTGHNRYFVTYNINQHLYLNRECVKNILACKKTQITDCRDAKPSLNEMILTIDLS